MIYLFPLAVKDRQTHTHTQRQSGHFIYSNQPQVLQSPDFTQCPDPVPNVLDPCPGPTISVLL